MAEYDPSTALFYALFAVEAGAAVIVLTAPWLLFGWALMGLADLMLAVLLWPSVIAMWPMLGAAGVAWVIRWMHGKGGPPGGAA